MKSILALPGLDHIRLYAELDCDCRKRHNKRVNSTLFVGYRVHTWSRFLDMDQRNPESNRLHVVEVRSRDALLVL